MRKFNGNENAIVRIKGDGRGVKDFYAALIAVAELADMPVQALYELWLSQVVSGMSRDEIEVDLLEMLTGSENDE